MCLTRMDIMFQLCDGIREQEIEILKMVDKKETEIREQEKEIADTADKKDSGKRGFNWKALGGASMFAITVVGVGAAALGGNFIVKPPKTTKEILMEV